ncbi:MAG: PD-(D/E)XK nuclease family protein [Candidatus Omnitrophica bacterium]|nr:PD-(D/E)XK nuclease family protein [Candidatus Omnitrophota bacterium]
MNNQPSGMIKLSPSSLNLFLECPRCFWLYINKNIKRPEKPVATITTGLDRVIKGYFESFRDTDKLPPILQGKLPGKLMRNLPHKGWLEFVDWQVQAKLGGYLDECLDLGDNFYAALDHKTRGTKPESTHPAHQFQMDAYTFLLECNHFSTKRVAYLVYYVPKIFAGKNTVEFDVIPFELKTDPQHVQKVFYEALEVLRKPIPAPDRDCEFCQWINTVNIK